MNISKLNEIIKAEPAYRLDQINKALFCDFLENWEEATVLPKDLRDLLNQECPLNIIAEIFESEDKKTIKALITFDDNNSVETVLMRYKDNKNTACISSQIGCQLNCDFCATGKLGFKRNLKSNEIVEQIIFWERFLKKQEQKVTSIVFMGMGEPFLNYDQVLEAIRIINDKDKINLGGRHISISTSGIIEGIKKLADEPLQINLAFSLNAPDNDLRNKLMPINKMYPLEKVLKALAEYIEKTNRKVMIEYVLIKDINDSKLQAMELAEILKENLPKLFMVNLIPYNPTEKYQSSPVEKIKIFREVLEQKGIEVTQRQRFGRHILGACGQLSGKKN